MSWFRVASPIAVAATVVLLFEGIAATSAQAGTPVRAFSDASWWNTPLPVNAPVHPDSAAMISWLKADNDKDNIRLAGTSDTGAWGMPIFWADAGDKQYKVVSTGYTLPPEFASLRIPAEAKADPTSDAAMTVWDLERGYVSALFRAEYVASTGQWKAAGGAIYYLASNGLVGSLPEADEPRNVGHRGVPPSSFAVRYDEIQVGAIEHVLKIAVNTTKAANVWPMTGHENGTTAPFAPPEGTRIRIKSSFDLTAVTMSPAARTIATALQKYGAVIGDQSGGNPTLKVENTVAEGLGSLWKGVLSAASLSMIPLDAYEVIEHGYKPPLAPDGGGSDGGDGGDPDGGDSGSDSPIVDVRKPNKKKAPSGKMLRIAWVSEGQDTWARLRYKAKGTPTKTIRNWTIDDGVYDWKVPEKLEGKRARVLLFVYDWATATWGWDHSRWIRVT